MNQMPALLKVCAATRATGRAGDAAQLCGVIADAPTPPLCRARCRCSWRAAVWMSRTRRPAGLTTSRSRTQVTGFCAPVGDPGISVPSFVCHALPRVQAHCCCIAGACLAVGIRFAGSGNAGADALLRHYVRYFIKSKQAAPEPGTGVLLQRGVVVSDAAKLTHAMCVAPLCPGNRALKHHHQGGARTVRVHRGARTLSRHGWQRALADPQAAARCVVVAHLRASLNALPHNRGAPMQRCTSASRLLQWPTRNSRGQATRPRAASRLAHTWQSGEWNARMG